MGNVPQNYSTNLMGPVTATQIYDSANQNFKIWDGSVTVGSGISLSVDITGVETVYIGGAAPISGDSTMSYFRATGLNLSTTTIKPTPGNLYGWSSVNVGSIPAYVKFYEMPASNVNPGVTSPIKVIMVPAMGTHVESVVGISQRYFTGVSVLATSTLADLGTQVAPTGGSLYFECSYK